MEKMAYANNITDTGGKTEGISKILSFKRKTKNITRIFDNLGKGKELFTD